MDPSKGCISRVQDGWRARIHSGLLAFSQGSPGWTKAFWARVHLDPSEHFLLSNIISPLPPLLQLGPPSLLGLCIPIDLRPARIILTTRYVSPPTTIAVSIRCLPHQAATPSGIHPILNHQTWQVIHLPFPCS